MKEINSSVELQAVAGGIAPLAALGYVAAAYAVGWIGGYAKTKYEQPKPEQPSSPPPSAGCEPTC